MSRPSQANYLAIWGPYKGLARNDGAKYAVLYQSNKKKLFTKTMAARLRKLKVGERVKVNATVFDTAEQLAGIEPRWSVIHFPLTWKTA